MAMKRYSYWKEVNGLIDKALELNQNLRIAYLEEACPNNPDLLEEALDYLSFIERAHQEHFLEGGIRPGSHLFKNLPPPERLDAILQPVIGHRIGPYQIVKPLGEGGMGTVYLAERTDGEFEQTVAIKFLRGGFFSPNMRERFKREKQILSKLHHPHIARLLDGGITDEGTPYIILEYIDGTPVDEYCRDNRLTIHERLKIFLQICRAVQYAHSQLIIHRDLKPQNIFINREEQVKIMDFGIAKFLNSDPDEASLVLTRKGHHVASVEFAAPEQFRTEALSTATDVYGLGVLLYLLLTGGKPFTFSGLSMREIETKVFQEVPPNPSRYSKEEIGPVPADLDAIVQKTLRKEPKERYESVDALEADIDRHLKGLPVTARPESVGYRIRKFVQRHHSGVLITAIITLIFIGFAILYTVRVTTERNRAEQAAVQAQLEAQKAEQVTSILIDLFEANNPFESAGKVITVEDLLERGENQAENLQGYPATQAQMFDVIGQIYHHLGLYDLSQKNLTEGYDLRKTLYGLHHPETVSSMDNLGFLRIEQGDYPEAENILRRAVDIREHYLNPGHPGMAITLARLAYAVRRQGNLDEAETLYRRSLQIRRDVFGEDHPLTIESLASLGITLHYKADYKETERIFREVLERRRAVLGPMHGKTVLSINNLGALLMNTGHFDEAESLFREALDIKKELYGDEHPRVALTLNNLAITLRDQELNTQASLFFKQALEMRVKLLGHDHVDTAISKFSMAKLLLQTGQPDSALTLYRQAHETFRQKLSDDHSFSARSLIGIGNAYLALDDLTSAEKYFEEGIEKVSRIHDESSLEWALANKEYGFFLYKTGNSDKAKITLQKTLQTFINIEERGNTLRQEAILTLLEKIES